MVQRLGYTACFHDRILKSGRVGMWSIGHSSDVKSLSFVLQDDHRVDCELWQHRVWAPVSHGLSDDGVISPGLTELLIEGVASRLLEVGPVFATLLRIHPGL